MLKIKHVDLEFVKKVIEGFKAINEYQYIPVEKAFSRVLAENIHSTIDNPQRDIAHFDGYAVKFSNVAKASPREPIRLKVIGEIYPGEIKDLKIDNGEAVYVATGAHIPQGSDTLIPIEKVSTFEDFIEIIHPPPMKEWHVIRRCSDFSKGDLIIRQGQVLRPIDIEVLKYIGIDYVKVLRRLRIGILSIGSELIMNRAQITQGKSISTRHLLVEGFLRKLNLEILNLGIVRDDLEQIKRAIANSLELVDILITIGGASVGKKDLVHKAIESLDNGEILFHGVRVKPGRQTGLGVVNGKPIVMLPGLVQSTYVGMHVVLEPLIMKIQGVDASTLYSAHILKAECVEGFEERSFPSFIRVVFARSIDYRLGKVIARPYVKESFAYSPILKSDLALILPPMKVRVKDHEEVLALATSYVNWLDPLITVLREHSN